MGCSAAHRFNLRSKVPNLPNFFEHLPTPAETEDFTTLFARPDIRIERIISQGHTTEAATPYDQDHDEWVLLLRGAAKLWIDGAGERDLRPGDYLMIPAHQRHAVTWTTDQEPTIWLAIHVGCSPS